MGNKACPPQDDTAETIKIFEQVKDAPVLPVVGPAHLTQDTCYYKDGCKQPQVDPLYGLRLLLQAGNTAVTKVAYGAGYKQKRGEYPWRPHYIVAIILPAMITPVATCLTLLFRVIRTAAYDKKPTDMGRYRKIDCSGYP